MKESSARKVIWATTTLALIVGATVSAPGEAIALAGNAAAPFALNVPGSVLSAASATGAQAASLAPTQSFDWDFVDPKYSSISGTATSTPAAPTSALTAEELATWEEMTSRFAAPATKPALLQRVVAGSNVALAGFTVGALIGQATVRTFGFTDDEVCVQRNDALNVAASLLDGVNCDAFKNALEEVQRNADQILVSAFDPVSLEGITVSYVRGVPYPQLTTNLLTCFNWTGIKPDDTYRIEVEVWGADGTHNVTGSNESNYNCGDYSTSNLSGWWVKAPLREFRVSMYSPYSTGPAFASQVVEGDVSLPNPGRQWECEVMTTDGGYYTRMSSSFTEEDAEFAPVVCPVLPAGKIPSSLRILQYTPNGAPSVVLQESLSSGYTSWRTAFPQCGNGSCLLDLRKDGASCFFSANADACANWLTSPNAESHYACLYGTVQMPLSQCNVYATTFSASDRDSGHAYADPTTGEPVATQTSRTKVDELTRTLLDRDWVTMLTSQHQLGQGDKGEAARGVAQQCVTLDIAEECEDLPIFSPGIDTETATKHDLEAITLGSQPSVLAYSSASERLAAGVRRDWYRNTYPCSSPVAGTHCDEYPYYSTSTSGPGASLRRIPEADNTSQGTYLGKFYAECGIASGVQGREFAVVPLETQTTSEWCK